MKDILRDNMNNAFRPLPPIFLSSNVVMSFELRDYTLAILENPIRSVVKLRNGFPLRVCYFLYNYRLNDSDDDDEDRRL